MTTAVPSQEVQAKAGTYLCEGRVHIDYADQPAPVWDTADPFARLPDYD
jgi:hypothetical protein